MISGQLFIFILVLFFCFPYCSFGEVYCGDPEDIRQWIWHDIDLFELVPDIYVELDKDIDLKVDSLLWEQYSDQGEVLDDEHLEEFIRGIWRSHGDNDIRTIWNYFAAGVHPELGVTIHQYADFGTNEYNFKYPDEYGSTHNGKTSIEIRLVACAPWGGMCDSNYTYIDIAGHHSTISEIPDDWYDGEWAGRTFAHEFQHTIKSFFNYHGFEEGFAEAAAVVCGYSRTNVGDSFIYSNYDLVHNNSPRGIPYHASYSEVTADNTSKYTVSFLLSSYIYDHFNGSTPGDITDDLLYKWLRVERPNGALYTKTFTGLGAAADNYVAWGYQNDPELKREIFHNWTLANLLDGTNFDPKWEYPNHVVRIRPPGNTTGVGWLSDNINGYCNDYPDPVWPDTIDGCGNWYPRLLSVSQLGVPIVHNSTYQTSPGSWDTEAGIEIYAADYVAFEASNPFPPNTILSLEFDVHDEDSTYWSQNNLIRCTAISYGLNEHDPLDVQCIDMSQSQFPYYIEKLYTSIPDFGTSQNLVHTVVSSMENEPETTYMYHLRSYSITATAVPQYIDVSGTIYTDTKWYHGQVVSVTDDLFVNNDVTLTIEPGVDIKFREGKGLTVQGNLVAIGNDVFPCTFTSNEGNPQAGDWVGIKTIGVNANIQMKHCVIEYAEKGLAIGNSQSHTVQNNTFRNCDEMGLWIQYPTLNEPITGNLFESNHYGTYLYLATVNVFMGNTFNQNDVGMYMENSWINSSEGFKDLYFSSNDIGLQVIDPSDGITYLKYSSFSGNSNCAIYFDRAGGTGNLELENLYIQDGTVLGCYAGIKALGGTTEMKVRHCDIRDFGGFLGPNIGISCICNGRVDAGLISQYGNNRFLENNADIQYANRLANPPPLYAIGNCWDDQSGEPDFIGNHANKIEWEPSDCSGWGGIPTPPIPKELFFTGISNVYPNPTEESLSIEFSIDESDEAALKIYDITGRLVRSLVDEKPSQGIHTVEWDGCDQSGNILGNGVYICRLVTDSTVESKRIVLMR